MVYEIFKYYHNYLKVVNRHIMIYQKIVNMLIYENKYPRIIGRQP